MNYRESWDILIAAKLYGEMGFEKVIQNIEDKGVCANWDKLAIPDSLQEFVYAIDIACFDYKHPFVGKFIDWTIQRCERALADPRFETDDPAKRGWRIDGVFPGNHGRVLAALALARAMRGNVEPDSAMLIQGAREIIETELQAGSYWNQGQSGYMRAINLLLIAGDVEAAKSCFKIRKKFAYTQQHYDWLKTWVLAIPDETSQHIAASTLQAYFQTRFDLYRNPNFIPPTRDNQGANFTENRSMLRLELALLKHRYFVGQPYTGQWATILGYIGG